jgi:glycosyltransferase involved in cell wall biosynthesis
MNPEPASLVSLVTPFYNTRQYLAECIESVLAQTHSNWEYVLLDNRSTDGSRDVAEAYALRDPRIRVVQADSFVGQVPNYNRALRLISSDSRYCKIVQADDWIYPTCLAEMISVAEAGSNVAVVGSYSMYRDQIGHVGLPFSRHLVLDGRDACRHYFLTCKFLGSPTCVMYRSDLVRGHHPFFDEASPCEDVEVCLDLMIDRQFGFVCQVLSYNRRDNPGVWQGMERFGPEPLHMVLLLRRFGPRVFDSREYAELLASYEAQYYTELARGLLQGRGSDFWQFHEDGLKSGNLRLDRRRVYRAAAVRAVAQVLHPRRALKAIQRRLTR